MFVRLASLEKFHDSMIPMVACLHVRLPSLSDQYLDHLATEATVVEDICDLRPAGLNGKGAKWAWYICWT